METQEMTHTFLPEADDQTRLHKWIFEAIRPFIKGRTLEIESGAGSIARLFLEAGLPIHLNDGNSENRDQLEKTFKSTPLVRAIHGLDFSNPEFVLGYPQLLNGFDTLVALNTGEMSFGQVFSNLKSVLRTRGHLIIVAPAYTALYHGLEEDEDGWKKYNHKAVKQLLKFEFKILRTRFFNLNASERNKFVSCYGLSVLAIARKN
jgi:hypothetical protein